MLPGWSLESEKADQENYSEKLLLRILNLRKHEIKSTNTPVGIPKVVGKYSIWVMDG